MAPALTRLLHVADDPAFRDLAQAFLERSGELEVATETSPEAARTRMLDERWDAVVSDYLMPGVSGIELLRHLSVPRTGHRRRGGGGTEPTPGPL